VLFTLQVTRTSISVNGCHWNTLTGTRKQILVLVLVSMWTWP